MIEKIKNENDSTTFNLQANIHNRFDIEVLDVNSKEVKQKAQAFNIICDNLWTTLFNKQSYFQYIHYGRGSGTPSSSDTSLFSLIGAQEATNFYYNANWKDGIYSMTGSIQLQAATSVGETITEVGIASSSTATTLCTHAMIQDMDGNPISIAKTDTDIINIYATVYVHFNPKGYDKGSIRFHKYENYYCLLDCFAGRWGYFPQTCYATNTPSPGSTTDWGYYPAILNSSYSNASSMSLTSSFNLANKTITFTLKRFEAAECNLNGLNAFYIYYRSSGNSVIAFPEMIIRPGGDWFPESTITNENVGTGDGTTKDFSLDFQYAKDAIIYVDGVINENVTVDYSPPVAITSSNYLYCLEFLNSASTIDNHIPDFKRGVKYSGESSYFYNPVAETVGIKSIYIPSYLSISVSNNLNDWTEIISYSTSSRSNVSIPTDYVHYKYWKIKNHNSGSYSYRYFISSITPAISRSSSATVHFTEAPPEGAIITADYKCDCVAKNENNVFDMTVQIQLGEYTEET